LKTLLNNSHTLLVAEPSGRDVLLNGCIRACASINLRTDLSLPTLGATKIDLDLVAVKSTLIEKPNPAMILTGICPPEGLSIAKSSCKIALDAGIPIAIAEQVFGGGTTGFTAGQLLELILSGARVIFNEYDFLADNSILRVSLESFHKPNIKTTLIGAPADKLQRLIDEIKLDWEEDERPVYKPEICFKLACSLSQVNTLPTYLTSREKIAHELYTKGHFLYNSEDTRKAIGSLSHVWGIDSNHLFELPAEARKRGFTGLSDPDRVFELLKDMSTEPRQFTSASGIKFNVLYVTL
jgi:hypothetical protein